MKNLQDATERICELKGSLVALDSVVPALLRQLDEDQRRQARASVESLAEAARTVMLHADISDVVLGAFERDIGRYLGLLADRHAPDASQPIDDGLPLTTVRIRTWRESAMQSEASGFFFSRDSHLFIVTSRHVLLDEATGHFPDRIEIDLHTDTRDLTQVLVWSIPLYADGRSLWREATDTGGAVDVAVIELATERLPPAVVIRSFTPAHLQARGEQVAMGDPLTIVGFPLGFHDTVHHLPVARSASIASAYGVRFQAKGYFLTDARTHRGSSGAPVLRHRTQAAADGLPWQLLGVHSTRMDMRTRDLFQDESLGLNCAWYADVLLAVTQPD